MEERRQLLKKSQSSFFLLAASAASIGLTTAFGALGAFSQTLQTNTVKFPTRISIGRLYEVNGAVDPIGASDLRGKFLGTASGEIHVPAGAKLALDLDPTVTENPSCLNGLPNAIYSLRARYSDATDEVFGQICKLSELRRLDVVECEVTDKGVAAIEKLNKLERFSLVTAKINGSCFKSLQGLPHLRYLSAANNKLAPDTVAALALVPSLETINLTGSNVSDNDVKHFAALKNLHGIDLNSNPRITIGALLPLKACKKLEYINLRHTAVAARDLLLLKGLVLKRVEMNENVLSHALETELKKAFPVCIFELGKKSPDAENKMLFAPVSR